MGPVSASHDGPDGAGGLAYPESSLTLLFEPPNPGKRRIDINGFDALGPPSQSARPHSKDAQIALQSTVALCDPVYHADRLTRSDLRHGPGTFDILHPDDIRDATSNDDDHIFQVPGNPFGAMSVAFEPRNFIHDGNYPPIGELHDVTDVDGVHVVHHDVDVHHHHHHHHHQEHDVPDAHEVSEVVHGLADAHDVQHDETSQFEDAGVAELAAVVNSFNAPEPIMTEPDQRLHIVDGLPDTVQALAKEESPPVIIGHQRVKPIPKPEREPTKNLTGKYVCMWPNCNEEVREFNRKCEWNKHMDKHDRPYKCTAEGCEKLPGFTYSGGLLRHEREVHAKHGGPKNPLNCPHTTCKRHAGKGFTRQENLNEHLRRCHRNGSPSNMGGGADTDDAASEGAVAAGSVGVKRKRDTDEDVAELRAEVKKHRLENEDLRHQLDAQTRQIAAMMQQISELQQSLQQSRELLSE